MLRVSRLVRTPARGFATAVGEGFKVTAFNSNKPTASVTVVLNAGSRHEHKPGVAHVLSNFAFKSNAKHSAIGTIRQAELYGGVLSTALTREHLALTAEFLPGDEAFFVDLLASHLATATYAPSELREFVFNSVVDEARAAASSSSTRALELAHAIAFRRGLGNSLFSDPDAAHSVTSEDVVALHAAGLPGFSIVTHGLPTDLVHELFVKGLPEDATAPPPAAALPATTYHGGSTRAAAHTGSSALFVGFGTTTAAHVPALHALAAHLSPAPSVKWSAGAGPLAGKLPAGVRAQAIALPYSDAALFGVVLESVDASALSGAAKATIEALKAAAGGISKDEALRAASKAKFGLVSALESPLAHHVGTEATALVDTVGALDGATISKVAGELLKGKATFVAVGDAQALPYADEVGLSA